jgi:two-component system, OmpR family, phosphate regulon response regulator PhoB
VVSMLGAFMARILVIDADPDLRPALDRSLAQDGHERVWCTTGAEGIEAARREQPDLVLLEQTLPDRTGADVCRTLQKSANTRDIPFVFVSARSAETDRIRGFELGAADYVVKPFSVRELSLRVRAVLRRSEAMAKGTSLEFGSLRIDPGAFRAWVDADELDLTLLEFKLLLTLYENRDRVQTRAELLERAWGMGVSITTRTVDTHVKRLRDKLGSAGEYVQTVRGIGYRFAGAPPPSR